MKKSFKQIVEELKEKSSTVYDSKRLAGKMALQTYKKKTVIESKKDKIKRKRVKYIYRYR